jgi:uncharacterized protein YqgC (DUF456 family)
MDWIWYLVLIVLQITGLTLNILGLPGLWVMVLSTGAYMWVTWEQGYVHVGTLIFLFVLAIAAEVVEFVAGSAGAAKAGGSKLGQFGAIIGGIVGAIVGTPIFPVVGTIIGACLGSFIGSMAIEWYRRGELDHSMRVGWGAAKGRFYGILAKTGFGLLILLITMIAALPLGGTAAPAPANPVPPTTLPSTQPATQSTTLPATRPATLPVVLPMI